MSENKSIRSEESARSPGGIRIFALAIGLVAVIVVCIVVAYSELVVSRSTSGACLLLGSSQIPPAAVAILLAMVALNAIVRRLTPRFKLSAAELGAIYMMSAAAALISAFGLTVLLLPTTALGNYFADPQNQWQTQILSHLPHWMVPFDPHGPEKQFVSKAFFEGLGTGETIPWGNWTIPLVAWSVFALLLFFLMACLAAIFRKQWVENERLSFPLVQLPLEMCSGGMAARTRDRRIMWAGALIPFLFHGMNGLANIFPSMPSVNTWSSLGGYFITPPWNHMGGLPLTINFTIVGLTYLLPLDVGFSMWFFPLFMRIQNMIAGSYGYEFKPMPTMLVANECIAYQSMGAAVAVCAALIWFARPHLRAVWQSVWHAASHKYDREEWMSCRHAIAGSAVSFALLVAWCAMAGLNVWVAAFMLLAFVLLILIMMARCVAEIGTPMLEGVFRPLDLWSVAAAKSTLGVSNLAPLAMISPIFMRHPRTLMALFIDGMKLSDGIRLRRVTLGTAFVIAIPLAMVVSYYVQLKVCYARGALSLNHFLIWGVPRLHLMESSSILNGYEKFNPADAGYFTAGMLLTFFMYFMRSRYWWWPFHPLGYAAGAWWSGSIWWAMFFMGWLLKSLILRYSGMRMCGAARPFFLGLILGEISTAVFWAVVSGTTGCTPPTIPFN